MKNTRPSFDSLLAWMRTILAAARCGFSGSHSASRCPLRTMAAIAFAVLLTLPGRAADKVVLKLGTVAPRDSSFHRVLLEMGQQWRQGSAESIELRIYPGGTVGGEEEMVRRMKTGMLDAGLLTCVGLSDIDRSVHALQSIPMAFRSLDEVDYVNDRLRGRMEKALRDKGFVVLFWADAGWVRFFGRRPFTTPDELRKMKVFSWSGDVAQTDIWKAAGFRPVALETTDILPSLETGMIDAVPMPPYVALATQVHGATGHMLDLRWAPLVGALVVTEKAWNRIPPPVQAQLARSAAEAGKKMKARNRVEADEAVEAMKRRKLIVHSVTPAKEDLWRRAAEESYPRIRGGMIPAELFDEVLRLLADYRRSHPAGGAQ